MDPSYPFSYTGLLNDDTNEENTNQPQVSSQFQQAGFPPFQQSGFPPFQQPGFQPFQQPRFPPFQQPGGFTQPQWEQFLQWQQFQGCQQPQFQQQSTEHVDASPSSKAKTTTKKKGKEKKNVEESETTNHTRWPPGDEVLLFKATISIGEDPTIGNNQTNHGYWSRIEEYYNGSGPQARRGASTLRSHYHLIKPRLNKFNEFYLQSKSIYRSGWSDDDHINQAKSNFLEHQSNKSKQPYTYEHVWKIMKDTQRYCGVTQVHLNQSSKRTKTSSTGEYTSSASDANFGNTLEFGISLDSDNDDILDEQVPPPRPMGRDKAKIKARQKGKATCSSDYEALRLSLVEEIAETNIAKKKAIEQFDNKINKFYELEQQKMEMKLKKMEIEQNKVELEENKLLFKDTSNMDQYKQAEHEAMCDEIRKKYNMPQRRN